MTLPEYIQQATRTETTITHIAVDTGTLINIMAIYNAAGNMLDQYKKQVFYNKDIDTDNQQLLINEIKFYVAQLETDGGLNRINSIPPAFMDPRIFHGIIGLATESAELVEAIVKSLLTNNPLDKVNVQEELGDINWYVSVLVDALGADWENILNTNIKKLKARYPNKFTSENAINRNLEVERKILEENS